MSNMLPSMHHNVIFVGKYQGKQVALSDDTARYRMYCDLQAQLQAHGGKAMWKSIHAGVAPGIKVSGATRLQVIATLPHIKVQMTDHGAEVSYQ